ncbi:MAG: hypothetical protein V2I33_23135, partial [Kangiellaceae bacterium]|nr:hypothetical protein [Kangiellaceae bacterium]
VSICKVEVVLKLARLTLILHIKPMMLQLITALLAEEVFVLVHLEEVSQLTSHEEPTHGCLDLHGGLVLQRLFKVLHVQLLRQG